LEVLPGLAVAEYKLLLTVLNSISDGVMVSSVDGKFVLMNPAARRITGIVQADGDYHDWSRLFTCYEEDGVTPVDTDHSPLTRAMRGETYENIEMVLANENLTAPILISISAQPLLSPDGNDSLGGMIIFRDITERRRIEKEVHRSQQELQQFAYVTAHDLQEPLRSISGYLSLLTERCAPLLEDAKAEKYVSRAIEGTRRMQTMIEDLLAYSRVSSKDQVLQPVDTGALVKTIIEDLNAAIIESNAVLHVGELPTIKADKAQLKQLFQNLITNALKYRQESPLITISAQVVGAAWQFSVADNGIGLEMGYSKKIFLIFQRLHGRQQYPGTGIGLAICKRIVEKLGGEIWVESSLNNGATFFFTLPQTKLEEV
jgi:signal transduction histidine kinase